MLVCVRVCVWTPHVERTFSGSKHGFSVRFTVRLLLGLFLMVRVMGYGMHHVNGMSSLRYQNENVCMCVFCLIVANQREVEFTKFSVYTLLSNYIYSRKLCTVHCLK